MDYKVIYYPESKFGGFTDVDGTVAFYIRLNSLINSSSIVLDIGCGRGAKGEDSIEIRRDLQILRGKCKKVIGIDIDEAAKENPFIDEFHLLPNSHSTWPVEDESIDLCIGDNILEHIEVPELFFSECYRVMKLGGYLCIRTPNSNSYIGIIARLFPEQLHPSLLRKAQPNRKGLDVFPKFYRCNAIRKIRHMLNKYGFDHWVYGYEAEPSYLMFSRFLYSLGVVHQRIAPKALRVAIFAFARKRERKVSKEIK
jgi:SAM-dependent methyltransferase